MDFTRIAGAARKRGKQALELLKEGAYDLSWDVRDAVKIGFGVPYLLSAAAGLGVATVAAAGGSHLAFDLIGKVFGKNECFTCNGWEALRCKICKGSGKVQYHIKESSLSEADRSSSQRIATAAMEGRAEVEFITGDVRLDFPLPYATCPNCEGTGVMKCTTCRGKSWVPKLSVSRIANSPSLAWNVYRKIGPPSEPAQVFEDPNLAAFAMFGREELQLGVQFDKEVKEHAMAEWEKAREYDVLREKVQQREPGWEMMQEMLAINNPWRAAQDPVIVTDPAHYKATLKVWKEVSKLPVPPRPSDWMPIKEPLKASDWTEDDLKDPRVRSEMKVLLEGQEKHFNKLLDKTWEDHWRAEKFEETKREMIDQYEREQGQQRTAEPKPKQKEAVVPTKSPVLSNTKPSKRAAEKVEAKKRPEEDKKKRERQERSERMARQAAEREAALAKAKAAREGRAAGQ